MVRRKAPVRPKGSGARKRVGAPHDRSATTAAKVRPVPTTTPPRLCLECGAASRCGKLKAEQDGCILDEKAGLIVVSDGVGGGPRDQAVARAALKGARKAFDAVRSSTGRLAVAVECASEQASAASGEACSGAATLLAADMEDRRLRLAWAGDTICYRLRGGRLALLTPPDRDAGRSGVPTNAVGSGHTYYHARVTDLVAGDRLLMCTGSVWDSLPGARISRLLAGDGGAAEIAQGLVEEAPDTRGRDATCVVVRVSDE